VNNNDIQIKNNKRQENKRAKHQRLKRTSNCLATIQRQANRGGTPQNQTLQIGICLFSFSMLYLF